MRKIDFHAQFLRDFLARDELLSVVGSNGVYVSFQRLQFTNGCTASYSEFLTFSISIQHSEVNLTQNHSLGVALTLSGKVIAYV